jgi:Mannose-6-phosphate isomerase
VDRDDERYFVHENESIYLPIGCLHRLGNPGKIDFELIEVQTGSYLGEDDIVRVEDIFNRTTPLTSQLRGNRWRRSDPKATSGFVAPTLAVLLLRESRTRRNAARR